MSMLTEPKPDQAASPRQPILWIDGVGGYLLVDREEVSLGQAVVGSSVDIPIVGDLSRQAGVIRRADSDYLLQPFQLATRLNGALVDRTQLLTGRDEIQFGDRVRLKFTKPNPLSATARLELAGLGRFQPQVDAVLLLADACILGPGPGSHVACPDWDTELMLLRRGQGWFFRVSDELEINARPERGHVALASGLRIRGDNFSLSIE